MLSSECSQEQIHMPAGSIYHHHPRCQFQMLMLHHSSLHHYLCLKSIQMYTKHSSKSCRGMDEADSICTPAYLTEISYGPRARSVRSGRETPGPSGSGDRRTANQRPYIWSSCGVSRQPITGRAPSQPSRTSDERLRTPFCFLSMPVSIQYFEEKHPPHAVAAYG